MNVYLKIDWKSGQFVENSKDFQEGFNPYTTSSGETRYQKFYPKGITAELHNVELKDSNFGMQLVATFRDGDTWYNIQTPVLDQRDQVTTYAVEIGRFLPNLQKGQIYRVYPYLIEKDGKDNLYDKRGISFKVGSADGEKVSPALVWTADADESVRIPRLDWKEDAMTKKKRPTASSVEAQRNFFAEVFQRETERIGNSVSVGATQKTKADFGPPADEEDDVPF